MLGMDVDYSKEIRFGRLKELLGERRMSVKILSEMTGIRADVLSHIITGLTLPKTDVVARICKALEVPASSVCVFRGIEIKAYFSRARVMYTPPGDAAGDVTYRPLRRFLEAYLEVYPEKSDNDLYDRIEPHGRRNRVHSTEGLERHRAERAAEKEAGEPGSVKGLPYTTRAKLRQDRPLNIRNIYDICKYLGCSIDFVMSYK